MKKTKLSIPLILFCCLLINSVSPVASATEIKAIEAIVAANSAEQLVPYQGIMPRDPAGLEYLLFSMEADHLTNHLLTTRNNGKYFVKSQIPSDSYLFYVGTLNAENTSAAAGICYYNFSSNTFVSIHETNFPSGKATSSGYLSPSNLRSSIDYYGYIKNVNTNGYVDGYVQFYYLDMY